ncbi:Undecaprenyl-diphosphatase [anaerobic digester metagenome]
MQIEQAALLGILQGIAEWLPISSEGQTMVTMIALYGISPAAALSCSIFLHLGTMAAVLVKFRREFVGVLRALDSNLARTIIIATLCTGVTGLPLYLLMKDTFTSGTQVTLLIGLLLIGTGLILRTGRAGIKDVEEITTRDMVILGLVQGLSILPGISRSGLTTSTLLLRNVRQDVALMVSFMISVPAVLGAVVIDHSTATLPVEIAVTMVAAAFVTGYLSMEVLIRVAKTLDFSKFCIVLGLITVVLVIAL